MRTVEQNPDLTNIVVCGCNEPANRLVDMLVTWYYIGIMVSQFDVATFKTYSRGLSLVSGLQYVKKVLIRVETSLAVLNLVSRAVNSSSGLMKSRLREGQQPVTLLSQ